MQPNFRNLTIALTAEVRTLALHPLAIHTFIKAQAGSLAKALSESVMNSIDAFGTHVNVQLTTTGFVIEDDGVGFRTKEEIAAWFETLGFPHDEGNHRMYGKFGMGRAQMWAYAHTVWYSNEFIMRVDVQRTGLSYQLEIAERPVKGTRIEATFYNPLNFSQRESAETELVNLVKYVPGQVAVNDRLVTKDPRAETWDIETPEAWMRFDKKAPSLDVYNAGVLVTHFPAYRFRCTGTIVTKPDATLSLNIARNDILLGDCKVWPKIAKHFPFDGGSVRKEKPVKVSGRTLEQAGREAKANTRSLEETVKLYPSILTSVYGRAVPLRDLTSRYATIPVVFVPKGDEFGKRLSKLRLALALDVEVMKRFSVGSPAEFRELLVRDIELGMKKAPREAEYLRGTVERLKERKFSDRPLELFPELAYDRKMLPATDLDEVGRAVLKALDRSRFALTGTLWDAQANVPDIDQNDRASVSNGCALGDSVELDAWISSSDHLVLNAKCFIKLANSALPELMQGMTRLVYCALRDRLGADRGNRVLVQWLTQTDGLGRWCLAFVSAYQRICRDKDLPVPRTRLRELDKLAVE